MESYWVLRVKGRNRWQETVHTGSPGSAFQEALTLAENYQAEVTVFEARPVRVVSIKDVSDRPPEAPAPYTIWGDRVLYHPCGHTPAFRDGDIVTQACPVCAKKCLREAGAELKRAPIFHGDDEP